ncbi:MAG: LysE family transporter [Lewinellaceae bacterium]|nr:LysE family transporter [Lewinellaceae bacterium]
MRQLLGVAAKMLNPWKCIAAQFLYFAPQKDMILFAAGVFLSLMGSLPPGLISLAVAHTSIMRGFIPALVLALGAAFAEFFQAVGAVVFAGWFLMHPRAAIVFQMAAIPIFLGLAIYLWFFAKPPKPTDGGSTGSLPWQFWRGILVSVFNLLAIPYWVAYAGWLKVNGWWESEGWQLTLFFAAGVTVGTSLALGLYAWLANELTRRSDQVAKVANRVVALIFLGFALKLIYDLL